MLIYRSRGPSSANQHSSIKTGYSVKTWERKITLHSLFYFHNGYCWAIMISWNIRKDFLNIWTSDNDVHSGHIVHNNTTKRLKSWARSRQGLPRWRPVMNLNWLLFWLYYCLCMKQTTTSVHRGVSVWGLWWIAAKKDWITYLMICQHGSQYCKYWFTKPSISVSAPGSRWDFTPKMCSEKCNFRASEDD